MTNAVRASDSAPLGAHAQGRVIILGGGPAGLGLADGLARSKRPFTLLERAPTLGGLAQTVTWGSYGSHDLGPHKIFTTDKELMARVKGLLPADKWLTREKKSRIYMGGKYLPYPPSPFSLINVFGIAKFVQMVMDYGLARVSALLGSATPRTFEEDLVTRVGTQLYSVLFKPIAQKLWGNPADLDSKLSLGRVQTPKLSEVIGRVLGLTKKSEFEALEFDYPKGGLQTLWESIAARSRSVGEFLTGCEITKIVRNGSRVTAIEYRHKESGEIKKLEVGENDFVFSSLPLKHISELLSPSCSTETRALITEKVILNDLLLVFLYVDKRNFLEDSWVFIPDPSVAFHRLSEQESFDPEMTPNGSIVCCEVMNNELRPMNAKSDAELVSLCVEGLKKMGFTDFIVKDQRVIRLPNSYPVFRPGFEAALSKILEELDGMKNFRTIGRQGAFNYIGTLDALDIGYGAARWCAENKKEDTESKVVDLWNKERERTRHYPVLD